MARNGPGRRSYEGVGVGQSGVVRSLTLEVRCSGDTVKGAKARRKPGVGNPVPGTILGVLVEGPKTPKTGRRERFVKNVLWSWTGVAVSLLTGLWLSPFIIKKLGDEGYGVWALVFSFVEYYWLLDFGFRSATVKYSAHYRATGENDKVNEVINTGLAYTGVAACLLISVTLVFAGRVQHFFQISGTYRPVFNTLVVMVGCTFALGTVFSLCSGVVEGYQRFDLTTRVWITTTALRTMGLVAVLLMGFRLKAMAMVAIASLAAGYAYNYRNLRAVFPSLNLSFSGINASMFRRMFRYGIHTSVATISTLVLNQNTPLILAHFLPTAFVGYFLLPTRLLRYSVDMVCKVGYVTGSNAAEMAARREYDQVYRMGVYVNRYCYVLFAPAALALCLYGTELLRVWVNPEFALHSGPVVSVIAVGTTLGIAAQYNSSSVLYGLGRHQLFAYSLLAEAILSSEAAWVVIPRYGIVGAAWVVAVFMVANRGLLTSWLFCRGVERSFGAYVRGVYLRPTLAAIPALLVAWVIKLRWLPGRNWVQVLGGMALVATIYYAAAYFICLEKEHRSIPKRWIEERLGRRPALRSTP